MEWLSTNDTAGCKIMRPSRPQVKPFDELKFGGAMAESECTFADPLAAGTSLAHDGVAAVLTETDSNGSKSVPEFRCYANKSLRSDKQRQPATA
jgi:hypothetical protein